MKQVKGFIRQAGQAQKLDKKGCFAMVSDMRGL